MAKKKSAYKRFKETAKKFMGKLEPELYVVEGKKTGFQGIEYTIKVKIKNSILEKCARIKGYFNFYIMKYKDIKNGEEETAKIIKIKKKYSFFEIKHKFREPGQYFILIEKEDGLLLVDEVRIFRSKRLFTNKESHAKEYEELKKEEETGMKELARTLEYPDTKENFDIKTSRFGIVNETYCFQVDIPVSQYNKNAKGYVIIEEGETELIFKVEKEPITGEAYSLKNEKTYTVDEIDKIPKDELEDYKIPITITTIHYIEGNFELRIIDGESIFVKKSSYPLFKYSIVDIKGMIELLEEIKKWEEGDVCDENVNK